MATYHMRLRTTGGDTIIEDAVEADSPQQAVVALYRRAYPKLRPHRGIGLWTRFPGGDTAHVQMGYAGGGGTQLDSKIVVQWDEESDAL